MGPFEDFNEKVARALATLREAFGLVRQARELTGEAHGGLLAATEGTGSAKVETSAARLEEVGAALDEAAAHGTRGAEIFGEYLSEIGSAAGATTVPESTSGVTEPVRLEGFRPIAAHPKAVAEIRPHVGKRNANGRPIAVGRVFDEHGRALTPIHEADDDGPAGDGKGIVDPWRSYPRMRRHIEAHAAARLRQDPDMRAAVVYINMAPCTYPDGCDPNLSALIPQDKTLYVHQVTSRGGTRVWIYPGTGEAIERERGSES